MIRGYFNSLNNCADYIDEVTAEVTEGQNKMYLNNTYHLFLTSLDNIPD